MPGPGVGAGVGSVPVSEYNCVSHCAQHCLPLYVCSHCLAGMVHLQEDGLEYNDKDKECLEERKIFTWV